MKINKQSRGAAFKVGDKIVHFGQVYKIFKIIKQKITREKEEKIIFFKPYLKTRKNRTLICSIPVNNIGKTNIRRSISKKELRPLLKKMAKKFDLKKPVNLAQAREALGSNNIQETIQVLKSLWRERNDQSVNFTESRKNFFRRLMKQLAEEIAFGSGISLVQARKKIKTALKKGTSSDQ